MGIFGFVIGDLLGVPVEFFSRQERDADPIKELRAYGTYHQPFGSWSDDSSFTLCLMDTVIKDNIVVELKNNMIDCYKKGLFTPRGSCLI
jgi:ADP-ribosylglycohydrolase